MAEGKKPIIAGKEVTPGTKGTPSSPEAARRRLETAMAAAGGIGGRSKSLKWPHLYDLLRAKGYSKEKSARISNAKRHQRKRYTRIKGLPPGQQNDPKKLAEVLKKSNAKRKRKSRKR